MSKVSSKINKIKKKLDSISGLDDDVIFSYINKIDFLVDIILTDIDIYLKQNPLNGTIYKPKN